MIEDEVDVVARAIARAQRSTSPESPEQDIEDVSEQHRNLALLAIATLELHRASKSKNTDTLGSAEELEQPRAGME
jgi:hypothetical protein